MDYLDWYGLYRQGWGKLIVPEAYSHPAKFARGLIERIYDFCAEQGYVSPGSIICDPMCGISTGGIVAMLKGYNWVGIELEEKFVTLGKQNIQYIQDKYVPLVKGNAQIIQGDSQQLRQVLGQAMVDGIVTSPPYARSMESKKGGIDWTKAGRLDRTKPSDKRHSVISNNDPTNYGSTPGQLGQMKEGDFDAILTSPPWENSINPALPNDRIRESTSSKEHGGPGPQYISGNTPGQLGNLPEGNIDAILTSPPYEEAKGHPSLGSVNKDNWGNEGKDITKRRGKTGDYGSTPGQIGQQSGDTYWESMKIIYENCFQILKVDGILVVVVKSFVRNKQLVNLPDMTLQLLEHLGFEPLWYIRAWVVEKEHKKTKLTGEVTQRIKERKSFFRISHETNVRAGNYWATLSRSVQATYTWQAKPILWQQYRDQKAKDDPDHPPIFPTKKKVFYLAKHLALDNYREQGCNVRDWDDERMIDYEVVLIMQKGGEEEWEKY